LKVFDGAQFTFVDDDKECFFVTTDSDGDGYTDDDEIAAGTDPNDPDSYPNYCTTHSQCDDGNPCCRGNRRLSSKWAPSVTGTEGQRRTVPEPPRRPANPTQRSSFGQEIRIESRNRNFCQSSYTSTLFRHPPIRRWC